MGISNPDFFYTILFQTYKDNYIDNDSVLENAPIENTHFTLFIANTCFWNVFVLTFFCFYFFFQIFTVLETVI